MLDRCGTSCFEKGGFRDLLLAASSSPICRHNAYLEAYLEVGQLLSNKVNNLLHSRTSLLIDCYTTGPLRSQAALLYNPGGINLEPIIPKFTNVTAAAYVLHTYIAVIMLS